MVLPVPRNCSYLLFWKTSCRTSFLDPEPENQNFLVEVHSRAVEMETGPEKHSFDSVAYTMMVDNHNDHAKKNQIQTKTLSNSHPLNF